MDPVVPEAAAAEEDVLEPPDETELVDELELLDESELVEAGAATAETLLVVKYSVVSSSVSGRK